MSKKKPSLALALAAGFFGIISIPVAAFVSISLGIFLMVVPVVLTFMASS